MRNACSLIGLLILLLLGWPVPTLSQQGFRIDLPKEEEYKDRLLRSEKTKEGKLGQPARLIQNTVTHYNFTYNATRKLNEILQKAKAAHREDYSTLLPFYNFSLQTTRKDSTDLDSVIQKASSGIALHDLRNDWNDNLYLLWGMAYYLQEKFDSAFQVFQFVNYYYAPRGKDGYFKSIGSRRDGNRINSIASEEKSGLLYKMGTAPPKRNEALLWMIRTHLAQEQLPEAAGLIEMLRNDPVFPKRLNTALEELIALSFYQQKRWDSAAIHLSKALEGASTLNEKARWEFLTGQLFEKAGNYLAANQYYSKAIPHSADLILEIQARIAAIRVNRADLDYANSNVRRLLEMSSKEKYSAYQDIIYYAAAQMDLNLGNKSRAIESLNQSTKATTNNTLQRNKAFLQLAEISYESGSYAMAAQYYDSLKTLDSLPIDPERIAIKKRALKSLVSKLATIANQDSLLLLASLPEEERKEAVKKIVKQLRKQEGLQEDPALAVSRPLPTLLQAPSLFGGETEKGEWYFYNVSSRSRGQAAFIARWGNRPNMDNWRRVANMQSTLALVQASGKDSTGTKSGATGSSIDFETLYAGLPLTAEKKKVCTDSLATALLDAGRILIQEIEDCTAGLKLLDRINIEFSGYEKMDEVLFHQHNCAWRGGNLDKATVILKEMNDGYAQSQFTALLNGRESTVAQQQSKLQDSIYAPIYALFAKGAYEEAVKLKKEAEQTAGESHWTPQLLYIEAVYYVQQKKDSTAIQLLTSLQLRYPNSPLYLRATDLLDAISKRAKTSEPEKPMMAPVIPNATADTSSQRPPSNLYTWEEQTDHLALFVLKEVDPVLAAEAMRSIDNYNRTVFNTRSFHKELVNLDNQFRVIVISSFENYQAVTNYLANIKPQSAIEVVPWLPSEKYFWMPISAANLITLRQLKDLAVYQRFLNSKRP
ncbi:MAG: hypothetical protein FJY19_02825 [Bacteroidetes bacterium]|nr:hypothetical protein [Bacteroidota bacterium]